MAGVVNEGAVTFTLMQGSTTIGVPVTSGMIAAGIATVNFTLPGATAAGPYTIAVAYNPGPDFLASGDKTHPFTVLVPVTINTVPTGRSYKVNGVTSSSQQTLVWVVGSQHTVAAVSP